MDRFHLSVPERGPGPGVVVLHSWWGLNAFFRRFCDRLAGEGFVALAPDLYGGRVATTIAEARRLRAAVTAARREPAYRYLMRMIDRLAGHAAVRGPGLGVVGFSMGGHWALWLAQRSALPIAATVTFYAARDGDYSRSASSFLAHFAETDEWVSASSTRKLRRSLEAAGRPATFHVYRGTGHWFFERDCPTAFAPGAAALAWRRTSAFLTRELGRRAGSGAARPG